MTVTAATRNSGSVLAESSLNFLEPVDLKPGLLGSSAAFTSDDIDLGPAPGYSKWRVFAVSDQAGTCVMQQSTDGQAWYPTQSNAYAGGEAAIYESLVALRYLRVVYTNGSSAQGSFRLVATLVAV